MTYSEAKATILTLRRFGWERQSYGFFKKEWTKNNTGINMAIHFDEAATIDMPLENWLRQLDQKANQEIEEGF